MAQVGSDLRHHAPAWLSVRAVVVLTSLTALGAVAFLAAVVVPATGDFAPTTWWLLALFFVVAVVSDVVYVPVRHADAWEELTFVEIVLIWGALLLIEPLQLLAVALLGFLLAELLARRQAIKTVFNLASHAIASVGLLTTYLLLRGDSTLFAVRSVLAMVLAALVFTGLNLLLLSFVLLAADDVPPREFLGEQWALSLGMALGSVGIATMGLAIEQNTPVLLPFVALPLLAMWYAYRASSSHAAARERSRWLIELGQAISSPAAIDTFVPQAADALRRVYGADDYAVVLAGGRRFGAGHDWAGVDLGDADAKRLEPGEMPRTWARGVAVRFEEQGGTGVLAVGAEIATVGALRTPWSRSWEISETEMPTLVALTSAVSSAMRVGQSLSALTAETAKLQAVVDNATDGICVVDARGNVLLWSPAAQAITGITDVAEPWPPILRSIITVPADTVGHLLEFDRADEQTVTLHVTRVDVYGSAATSVITIRDMTRERRAERLKSDFIATISHELRTPITPIRGYADLLKRRWDRMSLEKRESVLDTIAERADHLARLVDDLLMAARADTETALRVDTATIDVVAVANDAAKAFPEVDGRLRIAATSPLLVTADRTRVMQIIGNLVGNALKYTPAGSPIDIAFRAVDGWVEVSVTDHGGGIAENEQEKVFERFYRIEDPLTMRTGGSGLGLHISRQLARAMGGDVTLNSSPGHGCTFVLRLRAEG
ncbi:MAG: PAS domain-containing sensor histidine kinase [Candidatus Nanopelagicales bacterium]